MPSGHFGGVSTFDVIAEDEAHVYTRQTQFTVKGDGGARIVFTAACGNIHRRNCLIQQIIAYC